MVMPTCCSLPDGGWPRGGQNGLLIFSALRRGLAEASATPCPRALWTAPTSSRGVARHRPCTLHRFSLHASAGGAGRALAESSMPSPECCQIQRALPDGHHQSPCHHRGPRWPHWPQSLHSSGQRLGPLPCRRLAGPKKPLPTGRSKLRATSFERVSFGNLDGVDRRSRYPPNPAMPLR